MNKYSNVLKDYSCEDVRVYGYLYINDHNTNSIFINVLNKLNEFSKKFDEQDKYIKTLENKIEELTLRLDYLPGGLLMQQAQQHFEELSKK